MSEERISSAAIYAGAIISLPPPARHHTILQTMGIILDIDALEHGHNQGFITSTGRYVNRVEAWSIARNAGQIIKNTSGQPELYSEDMW